MNVKPWGAARMALATVAAGIVVASLLALIALKTSQVQAGYRIHDLRTELQRLRAATDQLEVEYHALTRPARLGKLAAELHLVPPSTQAALPSSVEPVVQP
jgi:cell division protein FtsL